MYTLLAKDWRELSKAATQERDPKKFMELIDQLNEALEEIQDRHGPAASICEPEN